MTLLYRPSELSDERFLALSRTVYNCWTEALLSKALPGTICLQHIRVQVSPAKKRLFRSRPARAIDYVRAVTDNSTADLVSIGVEEYCRKEGLTFDTAAEDPSLPVQILNTVTLTL